MHYRLPTLNGPKDLGATVARLDAWLREADGDDMESAVYGVRAHLDEALTILPSLASMEDCNNESCSKSGDVEYLKSELMDCRKAVGDVEAAADDLLALLARETAA